MAIPSAGLALRQAGARVIRVDPVGGAPDVRRWPLGRDGRSLYWAGLNRGKESVELDLASAAGQAALRELVCAGGAGGGILLTNLAAKAWLADDLLRRDRPDLIYVQVTGRADGGPAVDYTVNAASGLAYATGPEDGTGPVNQALPAWDLLAGCHAAFAVLAAARHRAATGAGTFCRLPLEDVALSTLTTLGYLPEAQLTGTSRPPQGNHLYGTFGAAMPLADGSQVMIVALTGRQWRSLLEVTGTAAVVAALETALEADFSDEGQRYRHRKVLLAVMQPWFAARTGRGGRRGPARQPRAVVAVPAPRRGGRGPDRGRRRRRGMAGRGDRIRPEPGHRGPGEPRRPAPAADQSPAPGRAHRVAVLAELAADRTLPT